MAKEYGLITKKNSLPAIVRNSVFDSYSDSDEDVHKTNEKINLTLGKNQQQQIKKAQQNALAEDPTIYQYDEIFDEVKNKQKALKLADKNADNQESKYIKQLLKTADRRKKDYERHIERQVQKEREADADMYKDKEAFVTTAYRKKLEEMKRADELDRHEEYLESIGDVTKQRDLGGFYRHIYEQKLGPNKLKSTSLANNEIILNSTSDTEPTTLDNEKNKKRSNETIHKQSKKDRIYRKRKLSGNDDNDDEITKSSLNKSTAEHLPCNLDADSDFSIDSAESEDDNGSIIEKEKKNDEKNEDCKEIEIKQEKNANENLQSTNEISDIKIESLNSIDIVIDVPKVKIDKWAKRTVGDVFDAALMKYYERKALRQSVK